MSVARPDVLIIGAGSAGCVLADRLSARGQSVVVVEAGPDLRTRTRPPSISGGSFHAAVAEPGRVWPGLLARRTTVQDPTPYLRGRGVGGSSTVNAMLGLWGEVDDYDSWERDLGCRGWGWAGVEPYFRRIEVPLNRADHVDAHRVGGALIETCLDNGWAQHRGPFPLAGIPADAGPAPLTRDPTGQRVSAADAYLERARARDSVTVLTGTAVDRLIVEGRRVRGVVLVDGREIEADETVVSAGAIHSPAILLRSGLEREGVGANLQDHASVSFTLRLNRPVDVAGLAVSAVARFSSGLVPADLQLLPVDHHGSPAGPDGSQYGSLGLALMRVRSRGRVALVSDDPLVEPEVDLGLLSHPDDVEAMVRGVAVVRRLLTSRHFRELAHEVFVDDLGTTLDLLAPGAEEGWLVSRSGDYVHAAGSCAMGDPASPMSVVDTRCRVIGYEGIRVCDASVLPALPRANTHFPVMMVAERTADHW